MSARGPQHRAPVRQDLLYDPSIATPTHAERVRTLVSACSAATLCTISRDPQAAGYPYGSFLTFALDGSAPVFLISAMAEHTKNLAADGRCSLLVAEVLSEHAEAVGRGSSRDLLALGRATLVGGCARIDDEARRIRAREAYLAVHPGASYYVDFNDFAFWRLEVEAVRYIGGYGRMSWVDRAAWEAAEPDPLAPAAARIIGHMNDDHADALVAYCRAFSRAGEVREATMTGVDRYGFEMSAVTPAGRRPIRVAFSRALSTADEVRREMIALKRSADAALGEATTGAG